MQSYACMYENKSNFIPLRFKFFSACYWISFKWYQSHPYMIKLRILDLKIIDHICWFHGFDAVMANHKESESWSLWSIDCLKACKSIVFRSKIYFSCIGCMRWWSWIDPFKSVMCFMMRSWCLCISYDGCIWRPVHLIRLDMINVYWVPACIIWINVI